MIENDTDNLVSRENNYNPVPQEDNDESNRISKMKKCDVEISEKIRWLVYSFFLAGNTLISMDHGSIPASTQELRKLSSFDQGIGLFGSLVYFGNIIGSLFLFKLINLWNRKFLLIVSLLGNTVCLFWFVFTENLLLLFLNRILVGIFQSFVTIYMPVWCRQYGKEENRTTMIAFIQFASPIGIFFGYFIASICIKERLFGGWTFAFIAQGILISFLTLLFIFIPSRYFRIDIYSYNDESGKEYFRVDTVKGISQSLKNSDYQQQNNQYYQNIPDKENKNEFTETKEHSNEDLPLCKMITIILHQKIFVFSVLALSVLIYVISGVQYWISDYMMAILRIRDQNRRLFYFTLVCFTSPTLGVLCGTLTKNKICQNDMKKSLLFCFILSILASTFAVIVPMLSSINYFVIFVWLVLFFGGGIVPVITNIIVSAVPPGLDASGNSITNLVSNLGGYLPAPYVYGILSDINHDRGKIGMRFTMWYSIAGVIFYGLATLAGYNMKDSEDGFEINYNLK